MKDAYALVADHYDIMIDWEARLQRERPFFERIIDENRVKRVLDIGCGTGHHTRLFAEIGAQAVGLDPSAAMLARARALTTGDNPYFIEASFSTIRLAPGRYDLITVLGNSLAYVSDVREMARVLRRVKRRLNPGGVLCLQVINYDRVLATGDRWLPLLQREANGREYLFLREYRRIERHVDFTLISLQRDGTWQQQIERSRHFPITVEALDLVFRDFNYDNIRYLDGYSDRPYNPETSESLVVLAEIPGVTRAENGEE